MNTTLIDILRTRRSVSANEMLDPGPSADELQTILEIAHRVPDHGKIGPWRFVVFQDEARLRFGEQLAAIFANNNPDASAKLLEFERTRLARAPLVIAVISAPLEHKVPEWEQRLCIGAICQNILLAASALGYGANWLTEWYSYDADVERLLKLTGKEKIAGFIYIGTAKNKPEERVRPQLDERVNYWG